jgi:N-acylethanolamine-hydrolysing acid amidase
MFGVGVGVVTGIREGAFSISLDTRHGARTDASYYENIALIFTGFTQIGWLIRDALTSCDNFACAFNRYSSDYVISPGYLIMAGVKDNEGAVISRDRFGAAHVDLLSEDRWFLV